MAANTQATQKIKRNIKYKELMEKGTKVGEF
jgi:hypothetical protein